MNATLAEGVRAGSELGDVLDMALERKNVKQEEGAIGTVTKHRLTRQDACEQILLQALVRFISPEWYEG